MDLTNAFIPRLLEYTPTEFSTGINTLPEISLKFSLDMKIGTYGPDTTAATNYLNEYIVLSNRTAGTFIKVVFDSYDARDKKVVFIPEDKLNPGEMYTISLLTGFAADSGRGTITDTIWKFTVDNTDVETPQLVYPVGMSELSVSPIFVWSPVTNSGALYHIQISNDPTFNTIVNEISDIAVTYSGPFSLPINNTYYWRVRAEVADTVGSWGESNEFVLKTVDDISQVNSLFDTLGVVSITPPVGSSNLSDWPSTIRFRFNRELQQDPHVTISAVDVDTDKSVTSPEVTATASKSDILVSLTGSIQNNTRYKITVDDATSIDNIQLSELATIDFTGTYLPMYSSVSVLRNTYGKFLKRYTDDETNFQIHRSSIKCNRVVNDSGSNAISSLLTEGTLTFDMNAYVETHAAYCLIQSYMYELLEEAGRNDRVDTLGVAVESRLLRDVEAVIGTLSKEVKRLEVLLKGAPTPVSGVKSSEWDPSTMYNDQSISGIGRPKF